ESCDPGVCVPGSGCLACHPGEAKCNGQNSEICNAEGTGWDVVPCDPVQGVMCDPNNGQCYGACSPAELGLSYIGCEYYPTVTNNVAENLGGFHFAVAVANASGKTANIRIDKGAQIIVQDTVAAGAVKVINLPWDNQLLGTMLSSSMVVPDGAFRLRTDQPVTVYQYNPVEYTNGFSFTYTNDASLLLPVNTWTGDYWVVSRNMWNYFGSPYPGIYAVTASQDNTKVTLSPSATGKLVRPGGGVAADGTGVITLNQGDVLQVIGSTNNPNAAPDPNDLTGTHVTADKPIQVIGGHYCTFVPYNIGYCDHLEESIPPYETLAKDIIVTPPLIPTGGNTPKAQMVRIVATEPNTTLTYDPPQPGAPTMIANAGDYVELAQTSANFRITSNNKIVVAQYMLGQDAGGDSGDPAMVYAVPIEQYRDQYLFHAPINYEKNYVNIVAPTGASVTLDGNAVGNFTPIGGSGYGVARVVLPNNVDGNHEISANAKIGISVYGYGQYTSYWYPGGLDLKILPQ
ncbi:MAG TPA: IgGFc-binding protein, partial [Nannocystis sp.]